MQSLLKNSHVHDLIISVTLGEQICTKICAEKSHQSIRLIWCFQTTWQIRTASKKLRDWYDTNYVILLFRITCLFWEVTYISLCVKLFIMVGHKSRTIMENKKNNMFKHFYTMYNYLVNLILQNVIESRSSKVRSGHIRIFTFSHIIYLPET